MSVSRIEIVYAACCVLCAVIGAAYDVATRRIPNAFTLPAFVFGLMIHFTLGGWRQLGWAALAGVVCGSVFLLFHLAGGMGGGDVKLMAAAGCCAGFSLIAPLLLFTALAGGVFALGLATYRGRLKLTFYNMRTIAVHHGRAGLAPHPEFHVGNPHTLRLPYGLAIAAGSMVNLCLLIVQG